MSILEKTCSTSNAVIYYGIERGFAKENTSKWVGITGEPVFFVVMDKNVTKFKDNFLNKYPVVSIDDALALHPDAEIWVTYSNLASAREAGKRLLGKTQPNKIHFLEANLEYRIGCDRLGRSFHCQNNQIPMCTVGNRKKPFIKVSGSIRQVITQWQDFSAKLIYANQLNSPNPCLGCPLLKWGFWSKTVKCTNLRFLQSLARDSCNFRCVYCSAAQAKRWGKLKTVEGPTTYDVIKQFSEMPEFVEMGDQFTITFANGELCANIYFNEIIDILLKMNWKIELLSNLSIYREGLAELLQTGRVKHVISSLDAGTRETFKAIKGNDRFEKVVENLHRYPFDKTKLQLKYLFLPGINDNDQDVDGFYEIAKKVGAVIQLSADNKTNKTPFTENEKLREFTLRIINNAKADGIRVVADGNNINPVDVKFINDAMQ